MNLKKIKLKNKMKRATFKNPFNGMDNALKLIPESYKIDGNEFQITDGIETYDIRWDINEATVLRAENKNLINEDMKKMKHLMGFKSQDTLGTLKGEQRIVENNSFNDVWNKTKKLLNESDEETSTISETAFGMGFKNEGNLEGHDKIAEMEREIEESDDVEKFMNTMGDNNKLNSLASKVNTRDEKVEAAIAFIKNLTNDDKALASKIARSLVSGDATADVAQDATEAPMNEEEECNECGETVMNDRFDEIFEGMDTEEDEIEDTENEK